MNNPSQNQGQHQSSKNDDPTSKTHALGKGSEPDPAVKADPAQVTKKAEEIDPQWPASGKWDNPFEFKGAPKDESKPKTPEPKAPEPKK